ncbi:hypothetical protein [uncultured Pontibacter sp.]|uniref:hypothetical protein n=1 Tax=uncultured Pontibacter sp. TaxID=453356 RepID=UPI00260EF1A1|nr:hypothetical protein [uncultured Pontibacter sp.]
MKREKISGGFAVVGHALVLLFFVPLCLFLLYIITKNFSFEGVIFLLAFLVPSILVVRHAYTYADLYLEGNTIIVKKLFSVKAKPIAEYKTVEQAIMPLKYCIKFQDGSKACFALTSSKIFRHIISTDPDRVVKELRLKFQELKQEYAIKE